MFLFKLRAMTELIIRFKGALGCPIIFRNESLSDEKVILCSQKITLRTTVGINCSFKLWSSDQ